MTVRATYRRGVRALALLTVLWHGWTLTRWSWQDDDWVYLARTTSMGFWEYLTQDYNGHLMPAELLITRVVTAIAPLQWWLPTVLVALAMAGNVWLWGRAFASLAGERMALLLPLAVLALSPVTILPTIWWASALQVVPMQMFLAIAVVLTARLARTGSRRDLVLLLLVLVVALTFWTKALLLLVPIAVVFLHVAQGSWPRRVRRAVAPGLSLAALAGVYLVIYRSVTVTAPAEKQMGLDLRLDRSPGDVTGFVARAFGDLFAPGLLGGPWGTLPTAGSLDVRPPSVVVFCCSVVVLSAATFVAWRRVGAWLPLLLAATYLVLTWSLVVFSTRFDALGTNAAVDSRYHADALVVVLLAAVMAVACPPRHPTPVRAHRHRVVYGVALLLGLSLIVGNTTAAIAVGVHPGREWVRNMTADVHRLAPLALLDSVPPDSVLPAAYFPQEAHTSQMLAPLPDVSFGGPAEQLWVIGDEGHLRKVAVGTASSSAPGPDEGCGYALEPGESVDLAMSTELYDWVWVVQVNGFVGGGATIRVVIGATSTTMEMRDGLSQQQFAYTGAVPETVRVDVLEGKAAFCLTDLFVGEASATS